jgi:hypothetical protein
MGPRSRPARPRSSRPRNAADCWPCHCRSSAPARCTATSTSRSAGHSTRSYATASAIASTCGPTRPWCLWMAPAATAAVLVGTAAPANCGSAPRFVMRGALSCDRLRTTLPSHFTTTGRSGARPAPQPRDPPQGTAVPRQGHREPAAGHAAQRSRFAPAGHRTGRHRPPAGSKVPSSFAAIGAGQPTGRV